MPKTKNRVIKMASLLLMVGCMAWPAAFAPAAENDSAQKPITLVQDGAAQVQIVIGNNTTTTGQFAAQELQNTIKLISGAVLPIKKAGAVSKDDIKSPSIILGTPETNTLIKAKSDRFSDDLSFLSGNEGFAIRKVDDNLYIFGTKPKGVLNGVYTFLEDNTSILWFRAGKKGTAYTPNKTIIAKKVSYREKPAFKITGWHFVSVWPHEDRPTQLWMARNRCNYKRTGHYALTHIKGLLARREKLGFQVDATGGHNLYRWMSPNKYFKNHPEYYPLIDGKRTRHDTQLVFANKKMTRQYAHNVVEYIKNMKPKFRALHRININQRDNENLNQGPLAKQPIHLPDGKILKPGKRKIRSVYRSTLYFIFLNQVAKEVHQHYPKMRIGTLAYQWSDIPPEVKLADNLDIWLALIRSSKKQTLLEPANRRWAKKLRAWTKKTDHLLVYEYYGDGEYFPRPLAHKVQVDLQFMKRMGVDGIISELPPDVEKQRGKTQLLLSDTWDVAAMQYWLICQLYWNPDANLAALRHRYLSRVYQDAAPAMARLYKLIYQSWYASPAQSFYDSKVIRQAKRYIVDAGIADECRAALDDAARLANNRRVAKRVASFRKQFNSWMKQAGELPKTKVTVPQTTKPLTGDMNLTGPAWKDAAEIDGFYVTSHPGTRSKKRTVVRLSYDSKNLYIGIKCFTKGRKVADSSAAKLGRDYWKDNHMEIFLGGGKLTKGGYYQFAVNPKEVRYSGKNRNGDWNGKWSSQVKTGNRAWKIVMTVPWQTLGITPKKGMKISALFYRTIGANQAGKGHESSSWGGGKPHAPAEFGTLILGGS